MDFLSNLIKRPMSLVLGDEQNAVLLAETSIDTKSSAEPYTPNDEDISEVTLVSKNKFPAIKKPSKQLECGDGLGNLSGLTTCESSALPTMLAKCAMRSQKKSRKSDKFSSTYNLNEDDMVDLSSSQSSSPDLQRNSSKTSLMLSEINTNMDKVLNEYPMISMNITPTIKLSQVGNKTPMAAEAKLNIPSSQPQIKVAGHTPNALPLTAAGSASYEANSPFSPTPEEKTSIRPNGINKASHKFIGLTEFDESQIPELPDCLNTNIDEHLKTTFEDGFIPTLTVLNTTEKLDLKNNFPLKENLSTNEIISSDSEAYSECEAIEAEFQKLKNLAAAEFLGNEPTKETLDEIEKGLQKLANELHVKELNEPMDIDMNLSNTVISPNNCFDVELENLEKSLNKTIEMPRKLNNSLTQESNISIGENVEVPEFPGNSGTSTVTESIIKPTLNLTLDMSSSFCSARSSAPSSPAFPISNTNELYRFPQSPKSINKGMTYLEKSDYAKKIENSNKSISDFEFKSPQSNVVINENNELNTLESPLCLNSDDVPLSSILPIPLAGDNGTIIQHDSKQRRTFTVSSFDENPANVNSNDNSTTPKNDLTIIKDKCNSSTNSALNIFNDCAQANDTIEDMDVDVSMISLNEKAPPGIYLTPKEKLNKAECENASTPLSGEHQQLNSNGLEREYSTIPQESILQSQQNIVYPDYNSPFYQLFSPVITMEERQKKSEELMGNIELISPNSPNIITMAQRHKMNKDVSLENQKIDNNYSSERTASPPIPTIKKQLQENDSNGFSEYSSKSPPIPTLQKKCLSNNINIVTEDMTYSAPSSTSPPLPVLQTKGRTEHFKDIADFIPPRSASTPMLTLNKPHLKLSEDDNIKNSSSSVYDINKQPSPIQSSNDQQHIATFEDVLSAKEQTKSNARDEKDVENTTDTSAINDMLTKKAVNKPQSIYDDEFQRPNNNDTNLLFDAAAFDYLLSKGNNTVHENRSSLLLKFDPLLGAPVAITSQQAVTKLSPTIEEEEHCGENTNSQTAAQCTKIKPKEGNINKDETMSITMTKDILVENDCKKSYDNTNSQSDIKQNDYQMDELEKKIKNEVLKTEDIEKKLKDAESREENYIKRITEKDKAIYKMHENFFTDGYIHSKPIFKYEIRSGVIEAYEKAIAELISEKEQIVQSYEKQILEIKSDRDSNYQHLTSLETTFSDLHVKYEKSKEMTLQLKKTEEVLLNEKAANLENIRLQEKRYEKMKLHAMQQLEFANNKLELMSKEHHIEAAKLKASLKKEELARASLSEQLQQKARENSELLKICDELINGQGS